MADMQCSRCGQLKAITEFYKSHGRRCKTCVNELQRVKRAKDGNAVTRRYEKTPPGFLMRTYRNMQSRVTGVQWRKAHLYAGKELLSRDEFYAFSLQSADYWRLFGEWRDAGFPQRLAPSIDRIDSSRGYAIDNIRWITHSENSRLSSLSKRLARYRAQSGAADPPFI